MEQPGPLAWGRPILRYRRWMCGTGPLKAIRATHGPSTSAAWHPGCARPGTVQEGLLFQQFIVSGALGFFDSSHAQQWLACPLGARWGLVHAPAMAEEAGQAWSHVEHSTSPCHCSPRMKLLWGMGGGTAQEERCCGGGPDCWDVRPEREVR